MICFIIITITIQVGQMLNFDDGESSSPLQGEEELMLQLYSSVVEFLYSCNNSKWLGDYRELVQ